ncbi:MAG TPA: hypothetical protein VH988_15300 [Thermoanaerobaculia bacterium]|jgi:hypothetical protein|nr:hypothetical protein [Thermoanaerobaculia bacterium]
MAEDAAETALAPLGKLEDTTRLTTQSDQNGDEGHEVAFVPTIIRNVEEDAPLVWSVPCHEAGLRLLGLKAESGEISACGSEVFLPDSKGFANF